MNQYNKNFFKFIFFFQILNSAINAFNPEYDIKDIKPFYMLSFFGNEEALNQLLLKKNLSAKTIIEVGSYLGASTYYLANKLDSRGLVYAVDWWRGLNYAQEIPVSGDEFNGWGHHLPLNTGMYEQFLSNMIHLGISSKVVPIRCKTLEAIKMLHNKGVYQADLIYLDADHSYSVVLEELKAYFPFVEGKKGIICGDDWGWSAPFLGQDYELGVERAVKEFSKEKNLKYFSSGCFWWIEE